MHDIRGFIICTLRIWILLFNFCSKSNVAEEIPDQIQDYSRRWEWEELSWTEDPAALTAILKDQRFYNKMLAPSQVFRKTTNVQVAFYIESMSSFKAQTMDFEMDMYLAIMWMDHRLAHNHSLPILVTDLKISNQLWVPDLYFVNSKAATMQAVTTPNFMVLVYPDGVVFKSVRIALTLACPMLFSHFPLDEQQCPIYIQSYAYVANVVNLTWFVHPQKGFPISNNPTIRLNDMVIIERSHDDCSGDYPMLRGTGRWSCIVGYIRMKRLVMFHVFNTYIPTAMLVCISWLSFWLDPRASPARITLSITTLLTLTTMSNGARQGLPQVSYIKAIDIWLSCCTGFVFSVLLEYTLVSYFVAKKTKTTKCRKHSSVETLALQQLHQAAAGHLSSDFSSVTSKSCPACAAVHERTARRIDRRSRVLFPAFFGIFATFYWIYYLNTYLKTEVPDG